jgi:tetratricopeptide (TPR) repeat protein
MRLLPLPAGRRHFRALPFPGILLGPGFHRDLTLLGAALIEAGADGEAIRILEERIAAEPASAPALFFLGTALAATGAGEEAERAFRKAISFRPDLTCALNSLGLLLSRSGRSDEAREFFLRAIRSGDRESALYLANTHLDQNHPEEAARILYGATRSDPGSPELWRSLGNALYRCGELDGGIDAYRKALDLSPTDPELTYGLANLLLERGRSDDLDRARQILEKGLEHQPGDTGLLNTLGTLRSFFLDFAGAEEAFDAAIEADPKSDKAYLNMARLHLRARQFEHAERVLRDLLSIYPDHVQARELLSEIPKNLSPRER